MFIKGFPLETMNENASLHFVQISISIFCAIELKCSVQFSITQQIRKWIFNCLVRNDIFFLTLCFIYEILLILHVNSLKAISLWRLIKSVDIEVFSICGYPFDAVPQRLIQYWWNIWNSDKMQLNFAFGKCICRSLCVIFIIRVQQSGEYNGPDHPLKWLHSIAYLFV